jgi:hypothetical protein
MKTGYKILFGVIYTLVYAFLAIAMINPEGTGTGIFPVPLLTWGFLFIVLYLLGRLESLRARIFFSLLIAVHYLMNLLLVSNFWDTPYNGGSSAYKGKSKILADWEREPIIILFLVTWYVLGQVFIWVMFYREVKSVAKVNV